MYFFCDDIAYGLHGTNAAFNYIRPFEVSEGVHIIRIRKAYQHEIHPKLDREDKPGKLVGDFCS